MLQFDDEGARRLEAVYTTADVVAQRREVRAALSLQPGERVLDIGSGPGFLTAEMAREVGPGGRVAGVDPSDSMIAMGRRREPEPPAAPIELVTGGAEALPFADGAFDAVVSTQVLEYVEDVAGALAEARRVLRDGGRLLVLDTDWSSLRIFTRDPERMARVLEAWSEHLVDPHLPRRLPALMAHAGLEVVRSDVIAIARRGYDPDTYGGGTIGTIAAFVAGRRGVSAEEAQAWADEQRGLGDAFDFRVERELFLGVR